MPFPSPLSNDNRTTARASGYWSRGLVCLNPVDVVFQARAAESITDAPFLEFAYDSVSAGAYTDVWQGMVCYLSETTDLRQAKYRGRVRLSPTSGVFYIDLNGTLLNDGDYITVTRDTDLFARIRNDTLADGSIAYQSLAPQTEGLPYVTVLYDADNDGEESWTPSQTGLAVDADATLVESWLWSVSGSGAASIDDDTLENPRFTFEAGYHYLVRAEYVDDSGTENYQIVHVYCVDRTLSAPVVQPVVTGSVSGSLDDGWTASVTAYGDVDTILDRTHCAVWHIQHFGDNTAAPFVSNVLMEGRIRSSSLQTVGNADAGREQQVSFSVEGMTAYLRRARIPNDIVRAVSSPDEWGEIKEPTPYRMACYVAWTYTTLTNLGSFGVEDGAFAAWPIGGEPRGVDGGNTLDVLNSILEPIKAAVNFAPTGEVYLARTVSYLTDRSGVDTITAFTLEDLIEYGIELDSSRTYSQCIAFGGSFNSTTNTFDIYTAQSPSIVYGDGGETLELTREILAADSTEDEAKTEIAERASNEYAFKNPKPLNSASPYDAYCGLLIPTNYQRWAFALPASSNTLGKAYTPSDYWQLQSVSLAINADGSINTGAEFYAETSFNDAQIMAQLLPNNLANLNPVLPVLPNDPAFPTDPLENYPTDTPGLDDLQPIGTDSAAQSYTPWPPDVASQVAKKTGKPKCKTLQIPFKVSTNVQSGWTTILNDPYGATLSGSALISNGDPNPCDDLTLSQQGWDVLNVASVDYATYHAGEGFGRSTTYAGRIIVHKNLGDVSGKDLTITFNEAFTGYIYLAPYVYVYTGSGLVHVTAQTSVTLTGMSQTAGLSIDIGVNENNPNTPLPSTLRLIEICIDGETGGGVANPVYGDAFYTWNKDAEGQEVNVALYSGSNGLYFDNSKYTEIPPFSPSHAYSNLPFTGTGNQLFARMVFDSYAQVQNVYLYLDMCPQG